jgi:hypothetical protein
MSQASSSMKASPVSFSAAELERMLHAADNASLSTL